MERRTAIVERDRLAPHLGRVEIAPLGQLFTVVVVQWFVRRRVRALHPAVVNHQVLALPLIEEERGVMLLETLAEQH